MNSSSIAFSLIKKHLHHSFAYAGASTTFIYFLRFAESLFICLFVIAFLCLVDCYFCSFAKEKIFTLDLTEETLISNLNDQALKIPWVTIC